MDEDKGGNTNEGQEAHHLSATLVVSSLAVTILLSMSLVVASGMLLLVFGIDLCE